MAYCIWCYINVGRVDKIQYPVKPPKPSAPPHKANKHAGLTIQEAADFPFLVAMATTHCSSCHFPELRRERSVQSYLAFKGGSAEKHRASLQSIWAWRRRWISTQNGDLVRGFLWTVRHLGLERVGKTLDWLIEGLIKKKKSSSTRFIFVMFALSYVVSIPFEADLGTNFNLKTWLVLLGNRRAELDGELAYRDIIIMNCVSYSW